MQDVPYIIVDPPKKTKPPFLQRALKKLFLWFFILLGILLLSAVIVASFFEEEIGQKLVTEVNKQLKSELSVEDFSLSLISGFPNAAGNLKNVTLKDSEGGNLLEAQKMSFRFGLMSLFSKNIKVRSVVISDGTLYLHKDRKGKVNYDILVDAPEDKPDSEKSEELGISLEEAKFVNVTLIYKDEIQKIETKQILNNATLSGNFSSKKFSLSSFADIQSEFFEMDEVRFLTNKNLVYDARISVDLEKNRYEFENVTFGHESNMFNVEGVIHTKDKNVHYDLTIDGKEGNLESMLGLLPEKYFAFFGDFKSKGSFHFSAAVKGLQTERTNPAIQAEFGLKNGKISGGKFDALKAVNFTAVFGNGKSRNNRTSTFTIDDFKAFFDRELIEFNLKVNNLDDPKIDFTFNGALPLDYAYKLFEQPAITSGKGDIELKNIFLKGNLNDMLSASRIGRVEAGGLVEFDDAELTINNEKIVFDKGQLELNNNSFLVKNIRIEGAGSEINLDGKFLNVIPVLFADSLNSNNAILRFQATLDAPNIDFDRLFNMSKLQVSPTQVKKAVYDSLQVAHTMKRERFTKMLEGNFQAKIRAYNYNLIEGADFTGNFEFVNNELKIKGNTHAMNGGFNLEGNAYFTEKPYLKAKLICQEIDVREFFRQCENFGQEFLLYDNVNGELESYLLINAFWDEEGHHQIDKLQVFGDVSIKNGELIGFKMLYDFSDYIKIQDLRHIKFTNMRNWLEVRNRRIYIPAMFIQSNAMNLTASGEHTFENDMDYNLKINAGQVLFSKFKKYNPNREPQPAQKQGWFNLYYRIYGNTKDYKFESDKRIVKNRFLASENRKKNIQSTLKKEFGIVIADIPEPNTWRDNDDPIDPHAPADDDEFLDFEVGGESNKPSSNKDEFMWDDDEGR